MEKINDETEYCQTMAEIDRLMANGSEIASKEELDEIRSRAELAQKYEQLKYSIVETIIPLTP